MEKNNIAGKIIGSAILYGVIVILLCGFLGFPEDLNGMIICIATFIILPTIIRTVWKQGVVNAWILSVAIGFLMGVLYEMVKHWEKTVFGLKALAIGLYIICWILIIFQGPLVYRSKYGMPGGITAEVSSFLEDISFPHIYVGLGTLAIIIWLLGLPLLVWLIIGEAIGLWLWFWLVGETYSIMEFRVPRDKERELKNNRRWRKIVSISVAVNGLAIFLIVIGLL